MRRCYNVQAIVLPVNSASMTSQAASTTCAATHTVKAGETCYSIYTEAGITADEFAQLNPGLNCNLLQAGDPFTLSSSIVHMTLLVSGCKSTPREPRGQDSPPWMVFGLPQ